MSRLDCAHGFRCIPAKRSFWAWFSRGSVHQAEHRDIAAEAW